MLFLYLGKDQNAIQIDYYDAFHYEVLEDIVHHGLEGGQAVDYPKEYYQGFKQASIGPEGCLLLISGLNADVIETPTDI